MKRRALVIAVGLGLLVPATADARPLHYGPAKAAAQRKADDIAGKRARLVSFFRADRGSFFAISRWTTPDPGWPEELTLTCFADIQVRLSRSGRILTFGSNPDFTCRHAVADK
jgi:hypothetical protein